MEQATLETMQAQLNALLEENARLRAKGTRALTIKASEKGAVSVYGLMRFPVTLYPNQWLKLLAIADDIRAFITEYRDYLSMDKS